MAQIPTCTNWQAGIQRSREGTAVTLPAKIGGIGVTDPSQVSISQHDASRMVSAPLISSIQKSIKSKRILGQKQSRCRTGPSCPKELKAEVHHSNQQKISSRANEVRSSLLQNLQRATEQSCESGALSWLTVIPMTVWLQPARAGVL